MPGPVELNWEVNTTDQAQSYTITGAPRVFDDKIVIGNGGAEFGVRGYVSAYDAGSGELALAFLYTVPGNPADGFEDETQEMAAGTWTGEWWTQGWWRHRLGFLRIRSRPESRLHRHRQRFSPWSRALRSPGGGDNLFLASIVAVERRHG